MKRLFIAGGILAIIIFIVYQFQFADRRSRLRVEYAGVNSSRLSGAVQTSFKPRTGFTSLQATRKLVKEGTLSLQVKSLARARTSITKLTADLNGYVSSEDQEEYAPGFPRAHQTVRIPSEATDEFIRKVEELAIKMESKKISAIDVTEEFIDIESRLVTKKKMEARYHEIIKVATKVNDIMDIERQIGVVRADIESMEGRLKYLQNQASFSTLNLVLFEPSTSVALTGFGEELTGSLKAGWSGVLVFVKGLATVWPLLIVAAFVGWMYFRRNKKVISSAGVHA